MQNDRKVQLYALLASLVITPSMTAYAADRFDGKSSLVCTVHQLHECDALGVVLRSSERVRRRDQAAIKGVRRAAERLA